MVERQTGRGVGDAARHRIILYGLVSMAVAAGAGWSVWTVVRGYETQLEAAARDVVVAARELPAGHLVGPDDVAMSPHPGLAADAPVFQAVGDVVGQTTGERVLAGEPVRVERLIVAGARPRLDEVIEPGTRAVAV